MKMKKLVSLLVFVLVLGLSVSFFAANVYASSAGDAVTTYEKTMGFALTTPEDMQAYTTETDDASIITRMQGANELFLGQASDGSYFEALDMKKYITPDQYEGITDLSDTQADKDKLLAAIEAMLAGPDGPKQLIAGPEQEWVTINGVPYLKTLVVFMYGGNTPVAWEAYTTIAKGKCISFQGTFPGATKETTTAFFEGFDRTAKTVAWNDDEQAAIDASISSWGAEAVASDSASAGTATPEKMTVWDQINSLPIPMWIFWIAIAVIVIWKINPAKKGEWQEEFLSLNSSKALLGLFAVLIIIHHMVQAIGFANAGSIAVLENMGVCFVGAFFFFSGYGLYDSFRRKPDYLKGFFKKRLPSILVPFYVCIIIFIVVAIAGGTKFTTPDFIGNLTGFYLINSQMWYVVEIALFYILFYVIFRFIKNEAAAIAVMGVATVLVIVISFMRGHGGLWFQGEWWYNSTLMIFIGILVARYKNAIVSFAKKVYWIMLPACMGLTVLFYMLTSYMLRTYSYWSETETNPGYMDKFRCLSCQIPMIIFFVFSVLLLTMKAQIKNPVLDFLGKISLELYLIHNIYILSFRANPARSISNNVLYIIAVLVCAILTAWVLNAVDKNIIKLLSGSAKKKEVIAAVKE